MVMMGMMLNHTGKGPECLFSEQDVSKLPYQTRSLPTFPVASSCSSCSFSSSHSVLSSSSSSPLPPHPYPLVQPNTPQQVVKKEGEAKDSGGGGGGKEEFLAHGSTRQEQLTMGDETTRDVSMLVDIQEVEEAEEADEKPQHHHRRRQQGEAACEPYCCYNGGEELRGRGRAEELEGEQKGCRPPREEDSYGRCGRAFLGRQSSSGDGLFGEQDGCLLQRRGSATSLRAEREEEGDGRERRGRKRNIGGGGGGEENTKDLSGDVPSPSAPVLLRVESRSNGIAQVSVQLDKMVIKVCDFGLAQHYRRKEIFPISSLRMGHSVSDQSNVLNQQRSCL